MVLSLQRWVGKIAIVTGTSAGIGAAIAEAFVEEGIIVVGIARRSEIVEKNAKKLSGKKGKLYAFKADVGKEEDILKAFEWTTKNLGPISILVNNAAIFLHRGLTDGITEQWKSIFDINVLGLTIASREAIKIMRENNIDGHIININSIVGHKVIPLVGIYGATKYAVTAITETLRLELNSLKSKIKVTSLSPGTVETEILGTIETESEELKSLRSVILQSEDVAEAVVYVLSTPPHVQIQELIIKSVGEVV